MWERTLTQLLKSSSVFLAWVLVPVLQLRGFEWIWRTATTPGTASFFPEQPSQLVAPRVRRTGHWRARLRCFLLAPVSPEALALLLPNKSLFLLITWSDGLNTHTLTLRQKGGFWVLKNGLQSFWVWSFPIDTERGLRASQLPSSAVDFTVP